MAARTKVLVVGAGVSGLTTGVCLAEQGFQVTIQTECEPLATTSAAAGAMWDPMYAEHPKMKVWSERTYKVLEELHGRAGVRMTDGTEASRVALEPSAETKKLPGYRKCETSELPPGYPSGWRYTAPIVDMTAYLPYLLDRFRRAGGDLRYGRLASLDDGFAAAPVVVNCTGAAARDLVPDPAVVPRRGQLVLVTNPGLVDFFVEESRDVAEMTYVLPQGPLLVLGGSAVTDGAGLMDHRVAAGIRQRCIQIFPELEKASVIECRSGIRPARNEVRLEIENRDDRYLVHNYGHAGAGVTLSWGCAHDVTDLVLGLL
jgi:D-amino-acid oxidase